MVSTDRNYFRFVQWDITAKCNLSCNHCRSEAFYGDPHLPPDLPFRAVTRRLDNLWLQGVRRIHFLGGEPFVRDDLPAIIEYASGLGILCSVNTNGTLITPEKADAIVAAGTFLLTFSIDGHTPAINDAVRGRGSFTRALRGIRYVQEAKSSAHGRVRLICCHTLMKPNYKTIDKMVDLATDVGLQNLIVAGLQRKGAAVRNYEALALTAEEILESADIAGRRLQRGKNCHVQFDALSSLGKIYLNAKYNLSLAVSRSGCSAITSKAFLKSNGMLFPCQATADSSTVEVHPGGSSYDANDWESTTGTRIADSLASLTVYEGYVPCARCPALGQFCVPCPLQGIHGRSARQGICEEVIARALKEGVQLDEGIRVAIGQSLPAKILDSPIPRRQFLAGEDISDVFGMTPNETQRDHLVALKAQLFEEVRALLAAGHDSLPLSTPAKKTRR